MALPACQTFFFASGDVRNAMRVGADYAATRGIPVAAAAGNAIAESIPDILKPFINTDNIDSGDWGVIPASLPNVISVGAVNNMLVNQHFIGESVAVWAPTPSRYFAPEATERISDGEKRYGEMRRL